MRARCPLVAALVLVTACALSAGQDMTVPDAPKPPEPLFVRLSVYPTASLSRYDFSNDIDLYEIRIYVELRRGSQDGTAVADAAITSLSEKLDYLEDHYEKRIGVDKNRLPLELEVDIAVKGRAVIMEKFPLPAWLVLEEPRPAIVESGKDLAVRWRFTRFFSPVDVRAYDFRTGKEFFRKDHLEQPAAAIAGADLPLATIVRIYAIQSWLYKRFLAGEGYARGSEVNIIPWSQVFVRTK